MLFWYEIKNKKLKKITDRLKEFYFEFKNGLKNCSKFKDFVTQMTYLFDKFNVKKCLEEIAEFEKQNGNIVEAEIISQLHNEQYFGAIKLEKILYLCADIISSHNWALVQKPMLKAQTSF